MNAAAIWNSVGIRQRGDLVARAVCCSADQLEAAVFQTLGHRMRVLHGLGKSEAIGVGAEADHQSDIARAALSARAGQRGEPHHQGEADKWGATTYVQSCVHALPLELSSKT